MTLGTVATRDSSGPGSQRTRCTEGIRACLGHPVLLATVTTGSQVALTPRTSGGPSGKMMILEAGGGRCGLHRSDRGPLKTLLYPRQRFGTTFFPGESSSGRKITNRKVGL